VPDFNVADSTLLANDLKIFLSRNMDSVTNGRQVARIFHGIQSPCFSSELWCRNPFWGRGKSFRFKDVAAAAQAALIQLKTQAISK
jgi:ATP-dependent DNA helicase Q4